jgi:hypothetical protein
MKIMRFSRPGVPSRGSELILFGFAAFLVLAYCILAAMFLRRGMLGWSDALLLLIPMVVGAVPALVLGYFARRSRLRKMAELREYERILASLAD